MQLSPFTLILLLQYLYGDFDQFTYQITISFIILGVIGVIANLMMEYMHIE